MKYVSITEYKKHCANLPFSCQWDVNGGSVNGIDAGNTAVVYIILLELNFFQALVHMGCIVLHLDRFAVQPRINRKHRVVVLNFRSLVVYVVSCLDFRVIFRLQFVTKTSNSPIFCTISSGPTVLGECSVHPACHQC
jgi:hypothetical protein